MSKNIIFDKYWQESCYFIIIFRLKKFTISIDWSNGLRVLEISLGKINIIIGFPYNG